MAGVTTQAVAQTLKEASDALGEDVGLLIKEGPKALALTTNTQPVMLVAGVAAWRVWRAEGGAAPAAVAGHSLGEYSALVAAGVLTLAQAAPLVRLRAAAMQEAVRVGTGAMAAILGMEASKVIAGCAEALASFGPGTAEGGGGCQFQRDPDRDRWYQSGGGQGLRSAQGGRCQARIAPAGGVWRLFLNW